MQFCLDQALTDDDIDALLLIKNELGHVPQAYFELPENAAKKTLLSLSYQAIEYHTLTYYNEAIDALLKLHSECKVLPNKIISLFAVCAQKTNRKEEMAAAIKDYAENAVTEKRYSDAMNAIKNIYSFADGGQDMWMFKDPKVLKEITDILKTIADNTPKIPFQGRSNSKKKVAIVSVNLVDHVMAYSKTMMQFARYVDKEKYECHLYFTEGTWGKKPQNFPIRFDQVHSTQAAPDFMRELNSLDVKLHFCPAIDAHQSATWLAEELEKSKIDGVIFQSGVNGAVQWVAASISNIPVKASLCLGVNMYQEGMDATVYMNNENLLREKEFWNESWGPQVFISGGADRKEAADTPALDRSILDVPENAVVFGTMTNYIHVRITKEYLECVAKVLENCPESYFLCMGNGSSEKAKGLMEKKGLSKRCRWLGQQRKPFAALKLLDFYFNEFPSGGSQSIRECMACDVPAMAMKYSAAHHESVGADIVGPKQAILENNPDKYAKLAISWIQNKAIRQQALERQIDRSKKLYSADSFINKITDILDR